MSDEDTPAAAHSDSLAPPMRDLADVNFKRLKWLLMDVDGVLTDGGLYLGPGGMELKRFDVQDGLGVTLARLAGLKAGIITGRVSDAVARRAEELKLDAVFQGHFVKLVPYRQFLETHGVADDEVAYIGDDILDRPILQRVGLALCPGNARPEVESVCHLKIAARGGAGAVRAAVDFILKQRGQFDILLAYIDTLEIDPDVALSAEAIRAVADQTLLTDDEPTDEPAESALPDLPIVSPSEADGESGLIDLPAMEA